MKNLITIALLLISFNALADADADLNQAYKEALKNNSNKQALIQAQRTWLKFIKLDCDSQSQNFGTGDFFDDNYQKCINIHKSLRTEYLKKYSSDSI